MNTQAPERITSTRLPHAALRAAESYLQRQTRRVEVRAVLRQQRLFRAASRDVRVIALELADRYGIMQLNGRGRAALWRDHLLAYAMSRFQRLLDDVMLDLLQAAGAALQGVYYGRLWLLDMVLKPDKPVRMPPLNADAVLGTLTEDVFGSLFRSAASRQWREQMSIEIADLGTQVRRAVTQSLVEPLPLSGALHNIAERVTKTFNRVQTLTRTVVHTVSSIAAVSAYRANRDALDGYEWLTERDERVCPLCQALDGKPFQFDDGQKPPPLHWNCRCTLIPRVKADALSAVGTMVRETLSNWAELLGVKDALKDFLNPA